MILRKVDTNYTPIKDKTFVLYKGSNTSAYVVKDGNDRTQLGGTLPANSQGVALDPMKSLDSGVIWIGSLPYGWYILEETVAEGTTPKYFYLVVTANGTFGTSEAADGYSARAAAETRAATVYNANK